ncbi:AzlC family ABC transporter permease [Nocardioides sp. R1-1]|uniref:AzlC family ABC transporter permease n=1 Tax=Nocardioides sp. R1-1 TaxID=3383502 RepID=UPI0038D15F6D
MLRRGVVDALPLMIPAIPFAFVIGVAVTEAEIDGLVGWSSSPIIYAGAGQLTLLTLLGSGAAWAAAVTAALVVNARHAMYSVALAPAFQQQPSWFRWVGSYLLIDQMFVLADRRKGDPAADFRRYYLAAGLCFVLLWCLSVAIGLALGPIIPTAWGLEFAVPVMFTGMLIPGLTTNPKWVAALVAAAVTVACAGMPNRAGLLVGAAAGIAAGVLADRRTR